MRLLRFSPPFLSSLLVFGLGWHFSAHADHSAAPDSVTVAGSLQSELGCPGDWQPECGVTHLAQDGSDDVWQGSFALPAGDWEYKAALNDTWDESYGANTGSDNITLSLTSAQEVKFYYDHKSHWVTDNVNSEIAVVAGSFQEEMGCPGDWQPDCLRSWLQDPDGDGLYSFSTGAIPAGDYECKVAHNESWDENYGLGGVPGGDNIPFSVPDGATVTFKYDPTSHILEIETDTGSGLEPGDEELVREPVRRPDLEDRFFYFVLPDRFDNGDPSNDAGGDASGDPLQHGFLPTDKGFYHGGDLAGLQAKLDYLQGLGVSAIWMTPQFRNRWVQGDGTVGGSSAAYHGYWQIDYSQVDPHYGTNQELKDLIADAHSRGIKVFFDIVINHTGDVITYEEDLFSYRSKQDYPYRDANGNVFDDRDFAGGDTFPELDAEVSFPYTPVFSTEEDATVKSPAWLNDPIYYHNRGDSTFVGENSLYGDFFGLDDLFTEHPDVVAGMIEIHKGMISEYGIDGFRVDTVKHVNDELWEQFVPAILAHAESQGISDFFLFGEVFSGDPTFTSRFTTELPFPSVLDFGFDQAANRFAASSGATDALRDFFASDDYYTDADSNAYQLVKFIGNHDVGRVGWYIDTAPPEGERPLPEDERLARARLAQALNLLSRGIPLIYYGDEQGFTGDGGDKDAREDMFPSQVPEYNDNNLIGTSATTADDNFDDTHPLYTGIAELSALRAAHAALQTGAQIHRYSEGNAGLYAFSRVEREEQVEYLVVLNNSAAQDMAAVVTGTPNATFTELYPGTGPALPADGSGAVQVSLEGFGFAVYRAEAALPAEDGAPGIVISTPAEGDGIYDRVEVAAEVTGAAYAEVTFAVSVAGQGFEPVGTDDNAPYRVFYDVSGIPEGTELTFKAIVSDTAGNLNADKVAVTVASEPVPPSGPRYAIIHYLRDDGDYGDHTTGDYNDFWGLHLWGERIDPDEVTDWTSPKPFLGEDDYGRFAWIKLNPGVQGPVNFIVHRGDTKDGTEADRAFDPSVTPEIWIRQDNGNEYASQAEAQGFVTIHYHRDDGDYGDPTSGDYNDFWGLHLWGDAIDPDEATEWTMPKKPDGQDDFGIFWQVAVADVNQPVNFIIHRGDTKDPGPDQSILPKEQAAAWINSGDETIYESLAAARNYAVIHYHRDDGDYGDPSGDYTEFWGLHVWTGAANPTEWPQPIRPQFDIFGAFYEVELAAGASELAYIIHRGDEKDPGPDQFLQLETYGHKVWQLTGADPEDPYILPVVAEAGGSPGNLNQQSAYWVDESTIAWASAEDSSLSYTLHYAANGGLQATENGIVGADGMLTLGPGTLSDEVKQKFPHLAGLPALSIGEADRGLIAEILKGQFAVSAVSGDGLAQDATGLQIPGVLDDLYTYEGLLGATFEAGSPTLRVWAPTAKSVTLHLFDDADPATPATTSPMVWDPATGVWTAVGQPDWDRKYYVYEVQVYVPGTGQVETNLVTDPYSLHLAINSQRTQIIDLDDPDLKPAGWDDVVKPELAAPEDITIYEIHVRDFSVNDPSVPEELKGTFKAFTLEGTNGVQHIDALNEAGLTHLHLLPSALDCATINENKGEWQQPDFAELETYPPDSEQQQAAVSATAADDAFNWCYDPWHYTVPEGSYATDPTDTSRIVEFRELVKVLNGKGLRVVIDVVYNHTNASGQSEKSVLDRIVPGYYHRLNDKGEVETSTCCDNTATEHNMMEKLMIDSLVVWAGDYKVDAFRFDLMGHHMKRNMDKVQAALAAIDPSIYIYGEGWNFGEVADNARGENATQLNMAGTGVGTFSDRLRDAVRGGSPFDGGEDLIRTQGFINGLYYDPNELNSGSQPELDELLLSTDQIRVGLAGNLADYELIDRNGNLVTGAQVDYNGAPSGYTQDPQEVVTYISKHDNQTLYDNNAYKTPVTTTMADRVRQQQVGLSLVTLGQGVPFYHAGSDLLRSKSLDRDSFDSGDWFNKLDFTYQDSNWGVGLPVAGKNQDNWPIMQPLLANPDLNPDPGSILDSAVAFREWLRIRSSSALFRMRTKEEIQGRLGFHNTGPGQIPGLIVMSLDNRDAALDPSYKAIVVLFNANDEAQEFTLEDADLAGLGYGLHPVQQEGADPVVRDAAYDGATATFNVPGRTTAVFVSGLSASEQIEQLMKDVEELVDSGALAALRGGLLNTKLEMALRRVDGNDWAASQHVQTFTRLVEAWTRAGFIDGEDAAELLTSAERIIANLGEGDPWADDGGSTAAASAGRHSGTGVESLRRLRP